MVVPGTFRNKNRLSVSNAIPSDELHGKASAKTDFGEPFSTAARAVGGGGIPVGSAAAFGGGGVRCAAARRPRCLSPAWRTRRPPTWPGGLGLVLGATRWSASRPTSASRLTKTRPNDAGNPQRAAPRFQRAVPGPCPPASRRFAAVTTLDGQAARQLTNTGQWPWEDGWAFGLGRLTGSVSRQRSNVVGLPMELLAEMVRPYCQ